MIAGVQADIKKRPVNCFPAKQARPNEHRPVERKETAPERDRAVAQSRI